MSSSTEGKGVQGDVVQQAPWVREKGDELSVEDQQAPRGSDAASTNHVGQNRSNPTDGASASRGVASEQASKQSTLQVPQDVFRARTGSVVSFREQCDTYEIDAEADRKRYASKPAALLSLRFYIVILALFGPFVVTYSRTIINFAIIDMIHPDFLARYSQQTQQQEIEMTTTISPSTTGALDYKKLMSVEDQNLDHREAFDFDNSCPVTEEQRAELKTSQERSRKRARDNVGEKFEWNTVQQGLLKAAYSIGHVPLQVMGGRLSEIYGSHIIIGTCSMLIAFACFAAPFLASLHFYLMFADLMFLGIVGSFMTPALLTLFANWLTPSEKSIMISFYMVSSRLGSALSSALCGLLIEAQLSWRYLFYTAAWTSAVFSSLFWLIARNKPHEHPMIKSDELDYLRTKNTLVREAIKKAEEKVARNKLQMVVMANGEQSETENGDAVPRDRKKNASAPWAQILTSGPVWAFIVTKFCVKLAGDTVSIELPAYLDRVMHFPAGWNGAINAWNYVIFCASCLIVGVLAKYSIKARPFGMEKTAIRKLFQCTASFGVSALLFLMSMTICDSAATITLLMLLYFITTFGTGGEAQIPIDISERYTGTIHAIGSSLAVSGAIVPILTGFILKGHAADKDRWRYVWWNGSAVSFLGGLAFLIFGDATIQPFDKANSEETTHKESEPRTGHMNPTFMSDEEVRSKNCPADKGNPGSEALYKESEQI